MEETLSHPARVTGMPPYSDEGLSACNTTLLDIFLVIGVSGYEARLLDPFRVAFKNPPK